MSWLVADASVLVALLVDSGVEGRWAEELVAGRELLAPHLAPVEVTNTLRRLEAAGQLAPELVAEPFDVWDGLAITLAAFQPFAGRVWELRATVTSYDAWYVALAEAAEAPLATLDRRLARAPGPRCEFALPPER